MIGAKTVKRGGRHVLAAFGRSKMLTTSRYLEAPRRLRAFVRAHETSLVVLAALVGTIGGGGVLSVSGAGAAPHAGLFHIHLPGTLFNPVALRPPPALLGS